MVQNLKNKPLVEAIFEIRWTLSGALPGPATDPHYKILLGRLFDRVIKEYPEHEQLPTANMPDEMVGHIVQHRFRSAPTSWPLVQLGPGILTVNSTADYEWRSFLPRAVSAVKSLYEAHPKVSELRISNLILRYINAVDFDFRSDSALVFLKEKLKLGISFPASLYADTNVSTSPNSLNFQCSFPCAKPKGLIVVRLATGQRSNAPALVWEITFESTGEDLPEIPRLFENWLKEAHVVTDDWFFKMIEGELERRFSGE